MVSRRFIATAALGLAFGAGQAEGGVSPESYSSPLDAAFSPDAARLFVSDFTGGRLLVIDVKERRVARAVPLRGRPGGLCVARGGDLVYAAEYDAGTVAEVDAASGRVLRRLEVGLRPMGVALAAGRGLLIAANTVENNVSIVSLATGLEARRIATAREPFLVQVAPDESSAVVGDLLPAGAASEANHAATVNLLDLDALEVTSRLELPAGSTSVRGVTVSADGRWGYAVHTIGRFQTVARDLRWLVDNALTIIDLHGRAIHSTILISDYVAGAPDPWGIVLSSDGVDAWITASGGHELVRLGLARLHRLFEGEVPASLEYPAHDLFDLDNTWSILRQNPARRASFLSDRQALRRAGLLDRIPLPVRGPRGVAASADGKLLAVAGYFSGDVALLSGTGAILGTIAVDASPSASPARRGEALFHDASISLERRMSCATCHPDGGRTDGLRWDLPNDGIGTPQRTRSLLWSPRMSRTTARGVRKGIQESVPAGFRFLLAEPSRERVGDITAYLEGLEPERSPFLAAGAEPGPRALRGKRLFEGKGGCARCHSGEIRSDGQVHSVGTEPPSAPDLDRATLGGQDQGFVTPRLVELYRAGPFLHDGRAATLRDVFTKHDPEGLHGAARDLTEEELGDLTEYLLTL